MTNPVTGIRPAVVIMNMHYSGLGIARSLAECTDEIHGLSFDDDFFGNYSRHCTFHRFPDSATAPDACKTFLLEFAERFAKKPLLLATRDHDINLILKFRTELGGRYILPYATDDVLAVVMNKTRLFEVAREVSIYCPQDAPIKSLGELQHCRDRLDFPAIVKPVAASQWRKDPVWDLVEKRKAQIFNNFQSLHDFYRKLHRYDPVITVQEYIPGPDTNLVIFGSYHNPQSDLTRYFTCRKLLQYPAHCGTGVALEASPIPEIVDISRKLLHRLNYYGVSEIEYKYDAQRDRYALIEINPRHWDQHALGTASGVNLSRAMYQDLTGQPVDPQTQTPKPVKWIADDNFLLSFTSNLRSRAYPLSRYRRAVTGTKMFAVLSLSDKRPALHLYRNVLVHYWRYLCSFAGRRLRPRG
ncbi:MAG: hypothetical protein ACR2RB_21715 [Gammaproteobacteria bacterium]